MEKDAASDHSEPDASAHIPSDGKPQTSGRRRFLKAGLSGVGLLPYVAPAIQSVAISVAQAQGFLPVFPGMGKMMMKLISPIGRRRGRGRGRGFLKMS